MKHKFAVAAFLVIGLLSARMLPGATEGGVKGRVLVDLQGIEGIPLTLVNVTTGQSFSVRTAKDGSYSLALPNGSYVISSPGIRGLAIGKAPLLIQVTSGRFASANVELAHALAQDAPGGTFIYHNPIGCVASNQFPVFDIAFQPAGSVVSAKLYFKSNLSEEWFYTEFQTLSGDFPKYKWTMTPDPANPSATTEGDDIRRRWTDFNEPESIDPGVPPTHRAFLPKIQEGSGITEVTYYIQITLADFSEPRIREIPVKILAKGQACKGGLFAAPAGAPTQGLAVLTSGGLAGAPAGFGAVGISVATNLAAAGLSLAPLVVAETTTTGGDVPATPTPTPTGGGDVPPNPTPTPTPAPTPTPTPTPAPPGPNPTPTPTPTPAPPTATPTPTPSPTPSPTPGVCQVQVSVNPPGSTFHPCRADVTTTSGTTSVTGSAIFTPACNSVVTINGIVVDPASFIGGTPALSWSGACSGDAQTTPCTLGAPLPAFSSVVLNCGCAAPAPANALTINCNPTAPIRKK